MQITVTNGTLTQIQETLSAASGYVLPSTIAVTGATSNYNSSTGVITLTALTDTMSVTATGESAQTDNKITFGNLPIDNMYFGTSQVQKIYFGNALVWENAAEPTPTDMPSKGDIITLDGGTARYRVLGVSGSEALLLAMDDYTSSVYNSPSVTKTFDGGKTGQKYEGSTLDNLLNTTYYNSLSSNVRNAIVDQTRIQRMYSYKNPDDPSYDYHQQYNFDATKMRGLPIEDQTTVGSRHVFALDIKDIFDYLGKDTMTSAELNEMFFEQITSVGRYVWLSSAYSDYSGFAFLVYGSGGCVDTSNYNSSYVARPAFQVDLSNLAWAKEIPVPEKGDIITLDGGTARYRVLKTSGNIAEVLALDDVANSTFNSSSVTTTFSDGWVGQKYENSTLDNYMNSTFYNSLSVNIKAAIVQKAITQSIYQLDSSEISGYDFAISRVTSGAYTHWYKRKGQVSVGNRYCYALDLDDVAEYLGAGSGNTVLGADLNDMFFEQTTAVSKYVWLSSAVSGNTSNAFNVRGYEGLCSINSYKSSYVVRPAFQVDLSKVTWTKEFPVPEKGDIITLDGGTARYRVLKTDGNVAEVLALDDVASSAFNSSGGTTTFSDGSVGQKYENSTLDNYMNSTFYNSLSANIKAAIVQKAVTQSIYQFGSSEISGYDFTIIRITARTRWYKRKGEVSVGNRYCYAPDLDDVAEYLEAGSGNTVSGADLNDMFFEQTTAISKYVWLDSADSDNSDNAFRVDGSDGYISRNFYTTSTIARPAFQVDLSKVSWSKE